jgi:hypothetical protein
MLLAMNLTEYRTPAGRILNRFSRSVLSHLASTLNIQVSLIILLEAHAHSAPQSASAEVSASQRTKTFTLNVPINLGQSCPPRACIINLLGCCSAQCVCDNTEPDLFILCRATPKIQCCFTDSNHRSVIFTEWTK